ncbi:MAG: hypothetical protein LBL94_09210 [Prevotellaceae bacterium]|jgi:hypothetical protein|nr:hypothetical protein [Prevotellaceae bacterium]
MKQHKKIIVAALLLTTTALAAQSAGKYTTRYYKQVKVVVNGKERVGDGSGQFITFSDKGCYDSDKEGNTVGNGFLGLERTTAERTYYSGNTYWGDAMYIFTENYNRLNVSLKDKATTYVYAQATPPSTVLTCDLIKEKNPSDDGGGMLIDPTPVQPPVGGGGVVQPIKIEKTFHACGCCNGIGNCRGLNCVRGYKKCHICSGTGESYNYASGYKQICTNCSRGYNKCDICIGKGYCHCCDGKRGKYY